MSLIKVWMILAADDSSRDFSFALVTGDGSTDASIQEQDMWYIRQSTGVASIEKASAVGIVDGLQHFQKCV
jgi:hypothetical protein